MNHLASASSSAAPVIWVLADDRAGNRAQCLGVADRLGDYTTKEIRYTHLAALPNALRGASLLGVDSASRKTLTAPWPDVVITAGRRAAPVARWVKKQSKGKTKLVQLMWPDAAAQDFDCIVLPAHDKEHKDSSNILRVLGAPHRITPAVLQAAASQWRDRLGHIPPENRIAVLVGGSTKHGAFDEADFHRMGALTATLATSAHGGLFITTSRRTGKEGEKILLEHVDGIPHHLHSWQTGGDNPYLGYLALADAIIVSADSIAMCSEACATHKPVFIYQPESLSPKHKRFVNTLIATGYAYPLEEDFVQELRAPLKHTPLDSAATVAEHIRNIL